MNISSHSNYDAMSLAAATLVEACLSEKPAALVCLATGGSPRRMYEILAGKPALVSRVRGIALDEWHGIGRDHPSTCRAYLRQHVFTPWSVPAQRQEVFDAAAADPELECQRMAARLQQAGPFDICILGLGRNGHLGLNEPAPQLQPHAHVVKLDEWSQDHPMLAEGGVRVDRGMTFGMADLLASRRIVLLVSGDGKDEAARRFLAGGIGTDCPATFLHLHDYVDVFIDSASVQMPGDSALTRANLNPNGVSRFLL